MSSRIRTIEPEWLEDERLAMASDAARVLSIALILMADDFDNGRAAATVVEFRVFPNGPELCRDGVGILRDTGVTS